MDTSRFPHFETLIGITIAVFTAIFAINNMASGEYDKGELRLINEEASALSWYNAKSIKQTALEGQVELLDALLLTETVSPEASENIINGKTALLMRIDRYDAEKHEILEGSAHIPEEDWAQDVDGELGKVIGAKEFAAMAMVSEEAGNRTDLASLFFELCLVLGGISLLFESRRLRLMFFSIVLLTGFVGTATTLSALGLQWPF